MSTRAIIGIKNEDGTITGAWQWNDGDMSTSFLNSHFNTLDKAKELIAQGAWGTLFTAEEKDNFEALMRKSECDISYISFVSVGELFITKQAHYSNDPAMYKDYINMAEQDINHTFLFNPLTSKWIKDEDICLDLGNTINDMRKRIMNEVPFSELEKNSGIFEFCEDSGKRSLGVSYEDSEDNKEVYIFNIFVGEEYINISGAGTKENPLPEDVLYELSIQWNKYAPEANKDKVISHDKQNLEHD